MKTSLIVTAYNYGQYIERCLRSCLDQRWVERDLLEVILVDDGSQDDTLKIIEKFRTFPNFRVIANSTNVGVAEAANIGIRASLGRYFLRVDADDYISEGCVHFLQAYLEFNDDAFGVACDYLLVNDNEETTGRRSAEQSPISCGILYRRDLFVQAGLYNADFRHREEEELRRRLGDYYHIHYLHMPLYRYRMHKNNKTKQGEYQDYLHKLNALHGTPDN